MQTSLYLAAVILAVLRWVPLARPLYKWIPPQAQWLPSALMAGAGVLSARLGIDIAGPVPEWLHLGEVALEAIVVTVLAAQAGVHTPLPSAPREE